MRRSRRRMQATAALGLLVIMLLALTGALATAPGDARAAGSSLTVVLPEEPLSLDATQNTSDRVPVTEEMFEPLVKISSTTHQMVPWLAKSVSRVNALTWRVVLRQGIKFSDGSPLNADAIINTYGKSIPGLIAASILRVKNLTFRKVNAYTVDFVFSSPDPLGFHEFSLTGVWSPNAPRSGQEVSSRSGTGPYQLVSWVPGQKIVLQASANYWGPKPKVKTITYIFRGESSVRAGMIKDGEADIAYSLAPQDANSVPHTIVVLPDTPLLALDTSAQPLNDSAISEAINLAINRQALAKLVFAGFATPASSILPVGAVGYDPKMKPWPFNPTLARKLVAAQQKKGVDTSKPITLVGRSDIYPNSDEVMTLVSQWLNAIGLNTKVQMLDVAAWTKQLGVSPPSGDRIIQGDNGNYLYDGGAPASGYLNSASANPWPQLYLGHYVAGPKLQSLYQHLVADEARGTSSEALRVADIRAMFAYMHNVLKDPLVPLVHLEGIFGHGKNVHFSVTPWGTAAIETAKIG